MNDSGTLETFVPLVFKRRGIRRLADTGAVAHDPMIIEAVARSAPMVEYLLLEDQPANAMP